MKIIEATEVACSLGGRAGQPIILGTTTQKIN